MSNRYLTHLSMVFLLHFVALAGSFSLLNEQTMPKSLSVGPSVLKLQMATRAIIGQTFPQNRKKPAAKPIPSESTVASSRPAPKASLEEVSSGAIGAKAQAGMRSLFKAELRSEIEKNKSYPPMSRRLGQSGTVVVAFTLLEDGHIIDVRLDTPSRYERLNESALEAVKKVHKFKPIPKEWNEAKMDITVPVKFLAI